MRNNSEMEAKHLRINLNTMNYALPHLPFILKSERTALLISALSAGLKQLALGQGSQRILQNALARILSSVPNGLPLTNS